MTDFLHLISQNQKKKLAKKIKQVSPATKKTKKISKSNGENNNNKFLNITVIGAVLPNKDPY